MVSPKELAKLNKYHYKVDKYGKDEAIERINNKLKGSNYKLEKLSRGVAHYKHTDGHNVISVKGTDLKNKKDIFSDIRLGLGLSKYDRQFKNRQNKIKNILRETNKGDINYLTGHSLGSSIITSAMTKSKSIRDNIKEAHGFNTGYTGLFNKELKKDLKPSDKKIIKKKLTHHHIKGDVISESLKDDSLGKVIEHDSPDSISLRQKHSLNSFQDF
jgi:hypothetical protein